MYFVRYNNIKLVVSSSHIKRITFMTKAYNNRQCGREHHVILQRARYTKKDSGIHTQREKLIDRWNGNLFGPIHLNLCISWESNRIQNKNKNINIVNRFNLLRILSVFKLIKISLNWQMLELMMFVNKMESTISMLKRFERFYDKHDQSV